MEIFADRVIGVVISFASVHKAGLTRHHLSLQNCSSHTGASQDAQCMLMHTQKL